MSNNEQSGTPLNIRSGWPLNIRSGEPLNERSGKPLNMRIAAGRCDGPMGGGIAMGLCTERSGTPLHDGAVNRYIHNEAASRYTVPKR